MADGVPVRMLNIGQRPATPGESYTTDGRPEWESEWVSDALRQALEFHQFVLLDMECENAPAVLAQASKYELFNASFHWLIIDKNYYGITGNSCLAGENFGCSELVRAMKHNATSDEHFAYRSGTASTNSDAGACGDTFDLLRTMNVSINAEITVTRPTEATYREFTLYDLWNPGFLSGGKLKIEPFGRYTADGLVIPQRATTVARRRSMDGLKLKIMTVVTQRPHQPFETYLTTPTNTHLDSVHRYNYGLMSMLKDFYNFTFINRRTKSWGYLRNGSFDGMIGALSRREVDLGGSPMFFRQERHRVVSYTSRTFIERPCFIFRHPPRHDAVKNPFLLPFEIIVWYLMLACGATLTTVLCMSFYFEDEATTVSHRVAPIASGTFGSSRKNSSNGVLSSAIIRAAKTIAAACVRMLQKSPTNAISNDDNKGTRAVAFAGRDNREKVPGGPESFGSNRNTSLAQVFPYGEVSNGTSRALQLTPRHGDSNTPLLWANNCRNKDVAANISSTHDDGNDGAKCNYRAEKVSKSILLFLGGVCQQGLSEIPHLSSGRCTSFFILLFGYLMFQYYSASIVGSLLMEQPKSIKTLRNLIDSRLTLGIEDIPYSRDYFVRTTDADSLELHRTRIEYYDERTGRNESHFLPAEAGLRMVRAGGYAFHVAISAAYRIIRETFGEREICELSEIDMFPVSSQWMIAIVQKNSPYRDVITYGLRRLNEAGLMQRQRRVWQEPKPKCVRQIAPTDLIVGGDAVASAFMLLIAGVALSAGVLIGEVLWHRIEYRRRGRSVDITGMNGAPANARNGLELYYVE
ncbi:ionotropic receptor 75a-like [Anopheles cruzii]|uniref:ionotropic receptor 75a-like n=1 Tax=Anopheles cruzii TaxID=68878 RepID=UPI0022EC2639|nr:ionotropic receptor 75a-like [Anopheles cruzii]